MALTIAMLIAHPSLIDRLRPPPTICGCGCGRPVSGIPGESERAESGLWRADCYWERLGDGIERHPIAAGGIRRG